MQPSAVHRPHCEAPARADLSPIEPSNIWCGARAHRFEVVSRGDFVAGHLYLPASPLEHPAPVALLVHRAGESKDAASLAPAARWLETGLAVAAIDLPLHGERRSPKLSARLLDGIRGIARRTPLDPQTTVLVEEAARQATSDIVRTLDALSALDMIAADRIALVGLGVGAVASCYALAHDRRARCAVLAGVGGGSAHPLDPTAWVPRAEIEGLLVVAPEEDPTRPDGAWHAVYDAAPEPRRLIRHAASPRAWPDTVWDEIQAFVSQTLGR